MSSTASQGDKKLLVSFMSDSEDEANTSSSSVLSSNEDAPSSDDEKTGNKINSSIGSGRQDKHSRKEAESTLTSTKNTAQLTAESTNIVSMKESKTKANHDDDCLPVLSKTLTDSKNVEISPEVKKEKTKKAPKNEDTIEEVKVKSTSNKSEKLTSKDETKDEPIVTKSKRNSATDDVTKSVAEFAVDSEERNLAPPKTKLKNRSKSPRDCDDVALSTPEINKDAMILETSGEEQNNLMPPQNKSKSRSKSPKNEDETAAKALKQIAIEENIQAETEKQESSVDGLVEKPVKVSKKKKKQLIEDNEYSVEKQTTASANADATSLSSVGSQPMNKEASPALASTTVSTEKSESAVDFNEEKQSPVKASKSSRKSSKLIENAAMSNGEAVLETPVSNVTNAESPVTRKKHKKVVEESVKFEAEMSPVNSIDKSLEVQSNSTESSQLMGAEQVQTVDKPKKKKSSKASAEIKVEDPLGDSLSASKEATSPIPTTTSPVPNPTSQQISAELPTKEKADEILVDISSSSDTTLFSASEKVLEQALMEKFDTVAINEVQDLPSNEIKIVKPMTDPREIKKEAENLNSFALIEPIQSARNTIDDLVKEVKSTDEDIVQAPSDADSSKQSHDSLNDEIARYLENYSALHKPAIDLPTTEAAEPIEKHSRSTLDEKSIDEENSEFTYRRQSMDEFIKKILAEAREERQKIKGSLGDEDEITTKKFPLPDPTTKSVAQNGMASPPDNGREVLMPDRRLTSNENKRITDEDKNHSAGSSEPMQNEIRIPSSSKGRSLDADSEVSRILNARRAQKKNMGEATNYDEIENLLNDNGSSRFKGRYGPRGIEDYPDDDESITSSKIQLQRSRVQRSDMDEPPAKADSFLAKYRREREASQLPEDAFAPRRSDQTDDVIRERTRHIRVIVEQQADVAKSLNASARCMEELDNEIRDVRQLSLDWQARIESLESAVDTEYHNYEVDQQSGAERLHLQHMPDDRYLREELRSGLRPRRGGDRLRGESAEDEGFGPGSRRRSGSVASVASIGSGFMGGRGGGADSGLELDYLLGAGGGSTKRDPKRDGDLDFSERSRRGGSLTRDKLTADNLGIGGDNDNYGLPPRSRGGMQKSELATSPQPSEEVLRIRAKYSSLSNDSGSGSYSLPPRSSATSDLGGSSYIFPGSSYLSDSRGGSSSRRTAADVPLSSSRYGDPSSLSSRYSGTSSYGASNLSPMDSTRMRRAHSVTEVNVDKPSYRGVAYNDPAAEYRSKFLNRVHSKNDDLGSSLSYGGVGMRNKEKPFKSRFLRSGVGLSNGLGPASAPHDTNN